MAVIPTVIGGDIEYFIPVVLGYVLGISSWWRRCFLAVQPKTPWHPLWDHGSQEAQKTQRIIIKSNHPNSATKPHIMLLVMIYVHILSHIIPLSPISNIVPNYSYMMSIYWCRNIMFYPHEKFPRHPLYSWFTSHAAPHGRRSLTIWTCYWTRRWEVFFVKDGKTKHFKGKILGMIYIYIYKVGIYPYLPLKIYLYSGIVTERFRGIILYRNSSNFVTLRPFTWAAGKSSKNF